jgi:hypothetical protein
MIKQAPHLLGFSFSTAPFALASSGTPDPAAMMLLWYAVVGVMGLLSGISAVVGVLEWRDKRAEREETRRERKAAGTMGGYVTHDALLKELKEVYANTERDNRQVRLDIVSELEAIRDALSKMQSAIQAISNRHEHLEGRLNPITFPQPPPPGSRKPH